MDLHDLRLTGEPIRLRPFTPCDLPIVLEWHRDPRVMTIQEPGRQEPPTLKEIEAIYDYESARGWLFLIETRAGEPIGEVCLEWMNLERGLQPGKKVVRFPILINADDWGRGYGKEAIRLLLAYAFGELMVDVACAMDVDEGNVRSRALWRSLGFREVRRLTPVEHRVERPVLDFELSRAEWKARGALRLL
jgi:RimJ/RimL family protein N-acetyltransferase